jgi:glucose/arabinose dehydrogenase
VVAEAGSQRVLLIDPETGASRVAATGLPQIIPNSSRSPVGVTVGAGGVIYVTSAAENAIYRLRPYRSDPE